MYCAVQRGLGGRLVYVFWITIAFSLNDDSFPVMHQSVDHGGGYGIIDVEDLALIFEDSVRGQHDQTVS